MTVNAAGNLVLPKNRVCDEIAEALKLCPNDVIARIAMEVVSHVSNEKADVIDIGDGEFEIKLLRPSQPT
jgi:hypothetical protein